MSIEGVSKEDIEDLKEETLNSICKMNGWDFTDKNQRKRAGHYARFWCVSNPILFTKGRDKFFYGFGLPGHYAESHRIKNYRDSEDEYVKEREIQMIDNEVCFHTGKIGKTLYSDLRDVERMGRERGWCGDDPYYISILPEDLAERNGALLRLCPEYFEVRRKRDSERYNKIIEYKSILKEEIETKNERYICPDSRKHYFTSFEGGICIPESFIDEDKGWRGARSDRYCPPAMVCSGIQNIAQGYGTIRNAKRNISLSKPDKERQWNMMSVSTSTGGWGNDRKIMDVWTSNNSNEPWDTSVVVNQHITEEEFKENIMTPAYISMYNGCKSWKDYMEDCRTRKLDGIQNCIKSSGMVAINPFMFEVRYNNGTTHYPDKGTINNK